MIRILLADDHTIFRQGLKEILESEPDLTVTMEAVSGRETVAQAMAGDCDMVLLDISMPDIHGLDVLKQIKQSCPDTAVIILSMHSEEHYGMRALKAGASGYFTKDGEAAELIAAIRKVDSGGIYISSRLSELIAENTLRNKGVTPEEFLSDREYQVLGMIASGKRSKAIAEKLGVSPKTVSTYRHRLLEKLNMKTNEQLCTYARHHGLLD
ncbi:MAG: response regulator [Desulfosalsimonas sp.]